MGSSFSFLPGFEPTTNNASEAKIEGNSSYAKAETRAVRNTPSNLLDPRSPASDRTPVRIPQSNYSTQQLDGFLVFDPRSPGLQRTPVPPPSTNLLDPRSPQMERTPVPVQQPLFDPRSPAADRTPISNETDKRPSVAADMFSTPASWSPISVSSPPQSIVQAENLPSEPLATTLFAAEESASASPSNVSASSLSSFSSSLASVSESSSPLSSEILPLQSQQASSEAVPIGQPSTPSTPRRTNAKMMTVFYDPDATMSPSAPIATNIALQTAFQSPIRTISKTVYENDPNSLRKGKGLRMSKAKAGTGSPRNSPRAALTTWNTGNDENSSQLTSQSPARSVMLDQITTTGAASRKFYV